MLDFNRPDIVLTDTENKTALVTDTALTLTHNLPKTEADKITKYETSRWIFFVIFPKVANCPKTFSNNIDSHC
jgi:hypothetical protein